MAAYSLPHKRERVTIFPFRPSSKQRALSSLSIAAWVRARLFPSLLCGHGADNVHLSPRISLQQQHGTSSPSEAGPAFLHGSSTMQTLKKKK